MLQYMQDGAMHTLDIDDYTIQTEWDGSANKLIWQMPAAHPQQLAIQERTQIYESSEGQTYVVSKRNPGRSIDFEAELVLTELDAGALINWSNGVTTLAATVGAILQGTGWTVDDQSARTDVQEIREFYGTLVEWISEVVSVWGNDLGVQYDNANKVVHLYSPGQRNPTGCYLTEDLNLFEAPQARGKAVRGEYYNRLYLIGADGLMLPSPYYVEYRAESEPVVSHVEVNEDITDLASLQTTAASQVKTAATITRSYTCKVADLYRLRPEEYAHLKIDIYDTVILIERADYSRSYQEIYRYKKHPDHPEKNEVTLGTVPGTLSATAGRTYSVAREAASRAYNARKAAQSAADAADDASKVATDYIHDSGGSVSFGKGSSASIVMGNGLTFNGIKNRTVLWSSSATSMASGSRISINLSGYAAIIIGFIDNLGGIFDSGVDGSTVQYQVAPVNGTTQRGFYIWDYPRVRTFTVTTSGITFGKGGYLESTKIGGVPVGANLVTNSACCVPHVVYGFI